jgi:hypothetical protein
MTPKQTAWYWREWQSVVGACKRFGYPNPDRHELHRRALGRDKSSKGFTNADLDKVIAVFRSVSKPNSVEAQLRQLRQERTRLEWTITQRQAALLAAMMAGENTLDRQLTAERYIVDLMRDRFGTADITALSHERRPGAAKSPLEMLRDTLDARINTLRQERGWSIHELHQVAGIACPCAGCNRRAADTRKAA